ncbi:MAG TPA: hypothetical protein VFA43_00470 [Gemmatimonadaceae bacterium]|nr:hypothetical protein [Gemmatimonadaceae bacterium]
MTPEEFTEIERRARAAGYLPARYIRQAALDGRPPDSGRGSAASIVFALGGIGADLKTLHRATTDDVVRQRLDSTLSELVSVLRQLAEPRE